ncbi:MAG: RNA polymerase sigma factor [Candidatus Kapabacteria bacterium]|nr:RNA polymerase sigma factor [Candidatus Kapabacteria bacterium]
MRGRTNHIGRPIPSEEMSTLVAAFRVGDRDAFRSIYDLYEAAVYRFCRHMLNDEAAAKDAFQDTFIRFYEHRQELRGDNVRSWLFVIARRTCLNVIRAQRKTHDSFDEGAHAWKEDVEGDVALRDEIDRAMRCLPVTLREALLLREYEGHSYQEIAEICSIDLSLAKVRVHRARLAMRKLLAAVVLHEK